MTPEPERFDHVLVGTGQATGTLIAGLGGAASIAVIEGGAIGGTCVNAGCTPTKTLVASARVAHVARRAGAYGVDTGPVGVDFAAAMARMNAVRHASRDGLTDFLTRRPNVTLLRGWARFTGPRTLRVGDRVVRGERVVLNVGARAAKPPIAGLDDVPWLDSARILDLDALPAHLVILGGGYVALELGQVFRRLGSRVSVIEVGDRFLAREDEDVATELRAALEGEGVTIHVGVGVDAVAPTGVGAAPSGAGVATGEAAISGSGPGVRVTLADGRAIDGSHLLVATGRRPNTDGLGLDAAGVATDERGYVVVDGATRTSAEGVFALGDVNGRGAFTHTSVHDAQVLLDHLRGTEHPRTIDERPTVYALFTDPPLGRVGMTEAQARASGRRVLHATKSMGTISRAKEMGETQGFVKVLVDADDDRILGASVLGVRGDEVVSLFALAMSAGLTTAQFRRAVLAHPTVGELMPWVLAGLRPLDES